MYDSVRVDRRVTLAYGASLFLGVHAKDFLGPLESFRTRRASDGALVDRSKRAQRGSDGVGRLCPWGKRQVSPQEGLEFTRSLGKSSNAARHHRE